MLNKILNSLQIGAQPSPPPQATYSFPKVSFMIKLALLIVFLMFLFKGDPDLFDVIRDTVMFWFQGH